MDNILIYILKVSAGTSLLYLTYLLLFRKDTFYLRNRVLLMLTLILPLFFPLIKIRILSDVPPPAEPLYETGNAISFENHVGTTVSATVNSFDYNKLFLLLYLVIASLLLFRIIISLISTFRIIKKGSVKSNKFPRIIISGNQIPPFSFFPYAVIPAEEYKSGNYDDILDHEFAHIRQGHTFDLLLSELFIAFQWFNPLVWFLKRSVILNHEYLADNVSIKNKSHKEYQYRLLNFQPGLKKISLAHSFNSLIKNRIIMINKKPTPRMATLKNIVILPVVAFVVYAFATPEYHYPETPVSDGLITINETPAIFQKEVKGIVMDEAGKPIENVSIVTTGTMGNAFGALTGKDGKFSFMGLRDDASITFTCNGYNRLTVRADFSKEMVVKMIKEIVTDGSKTDPNWASNAAQRQTQLVVIDGVISDKNINDARKDLGYNMGIGKMLSAKEGTEKYGEKGSKGVYEITTRKKALEMGLKPPFPRLDQQDYPTFQGQRYGHFNQWVIDNAKYPAEAKEKGIEGWVSVNFTIELDGSLSNIAAAGVVDPLLVNEIMRVVKSAPKWEGPKNKNVDEPFRLGITAQFKLPDQILNNAPFVVVEEMPMYPGGDKELLDFIAKSVKYPEAAVKDKIEGKVIVRFAVNPEGSAEAISILKGVNPLLDQEAIRVVKLLKGFKPGRQGGKDVYVWYMVPVTFSLGKKEPIFSKEAELGILKYIGMNTGYPQEARAASDTGRVYVVVKLTKGGVVKDCKAYTEKAEIKAPFLPDVVVVGYKSTTPGPTDIRPAIPNVKPSGSGLTSLKNEALRVANTLSVNEIPDWKDKDLEFALTIIYTLK